MGFEGKGLVVERLLKVGCLLAYPVVKHSTLVVLMRNLLLFKALDEELDGRIVLFSQHLNHISAAVTVQASHVLDSELVHDSGVRLLLFLLFGCQLLDSFELLLEHFERLCVVVEQVVALVHLVFDLEQLLLIDVLGFEFEGL